MNLRCGRGQKKKRRIEKQRKDDGRRLELRCKWTTETSEKIEGLFLFLLEQLPEEAQIGTVDLGLYTESTRDTDNGPSSSTQALEDYTQKAPKVPAAHFASEQWLLTAWNISIKLGTLVPHAHGYKICLTFLYFCPVKVAGAGWRRGVTVAMVIKRRPYVQKWCSR